MPRSPIITESAVILDVTRHSTSSNGNPTYDLHLADGRVLRTETDGSVGYEATNHRPRSSEPDGRPVTLRIADHKSGARVVGIDAR